MSSCPVPKDVRLRKAYDWMGAKKIGKGTYGDVFKLRKLERKEGEEEWAAVKVSDLKKLKMTKSDIRTEMEILDKMRHRHVVNLLDWKVEGNLAFQVYEYVQHDLMGLLNDKRIHFDLKRVKNIMYQLISALNHLHKNGYMHRDIKPANIFVSCDGTLKLGDFSLCTTFVPERVHSTKVVSLWYRSPELILGTEYYGPEIDIWSAGCIFGELLRRLKGYFGVPALFNSSKQEEVLKKIFSLAGSPHAFGMSAGLYYENLSRWDKLWPKVQHTRGDPALAPLPRQFYQQFPHCDQLTCKLLMSMLHLQPSHRPLAGSILSHEWFRTFPLKSQRFVVPKDYVCNERAILLEMDRKKSQAKSNGRKRSSNDRSRGEKPQGMPLKRRKLSEPSSGENYLSSQVRSAKESVWTGRISGFRSGLYFDTIADNFPDHNQTRQYSAIQTLSCVSLQVVRCLNHNEYKTWMKMNQQKRSFHCHFTPLSAPEKVKEFRKCQAALPSGKHCWYVKGKGVPRGRSANKEVVMALIPGSDPNIMTAKYFLRKKR